LKPGLHFGINISVSILQTSGCFSITMTIWFMLFMKTNTASFKIRTKYTVPEECKAIEC